MALTWKDRLIPASYGGVRFLVTRHGLEGGRRGSVEEFPQRDEPYVEDVGRRARRYRIQAIVLGDDYFDRRDKLVAICETRGAGTFQVGRILDHPYLGRIRALCLSFTMEESVAEGRMARFSLELVESGTAPSPVQASEPKEEAQAAATAVSNQTEAVAAGELVTSGPQSVRDAIANELRTLGNRINALDVFSGPAREVALLAADVDRLLTEATALAKAPADAASAVRVAIDRIAGAVARTQDAVFAYEALFPVNPASLGGSGASGQAADRNAILVTDQIRETAVANLGAALAGNEWESRDAALAGRGSLTEKIEVVLETADPELQVLLSRMLSLAGTTIPPSDQRLPRLITLELRQATPSLLLAYQLYDDADRDQELADRAPAPRPGFVPGGVPIEVLSSD